MTSMRLLSVACASLFVFVSGSLGQEGKPSANDIARELANPNTPLASLNFKSQFRLFDGDLVNADDQWSYNLLFQPSFPFALDNGDTIFFRPAIPLLVEQPVFDPGKLDFDGETAFGDIVFDLAYGRTSESGLLTAFGLASTLPTASSSAFASGRWSIGPELLIGKLTPDYVLGIFPNHQWDMAGWSDNAVNLTTVQIFATLLPGDGWNFGSSPIMSYDWSAEQWNIPLNLNVGKTVVMGGKPWKLSAEVNYYIERSDAFAAEWMIGINMSPVVENPLAKLFNR